MGGCGRGWEGVAGNGRVWEGVGGSSREWAGVGGSSREWAGVGGGGILVFILRGRPLLADLSAASRLPGGHQRTVGLPQGVGGFRTGMELEGGGGQGKVGASRRLTAKHCWPPPSPKK